MSELGEREIGTFDFLKFGKLTLTEKALKGVIFSFQRPSRDKKQIGNTIAGNPGEIKVEHPIDAPLDRISRVDVNEGVLIGPVIYLWDAFVVLAMIVAFRFISNYMWSWFAWTKWFSIALLYGIYWGHDWVKRWVNFHFIFDGAPYRVLVDKSRRAELEQFVEAIKSARTVAYPSATALVPDAPRQQQVKLGMIIMSVACVIALILACCIGGCGQEKPGMGTRMSSSEEVRALTRQCMDIGIDYEILEASLSGGGIMKLSNAQKIAMLRGMIEQQGRTPNPSAYCDGGTGKECGDGAPSNRGVATSAKDVKTITAYPELEKKIYSKAVRLMTSKVKSLGGGSAQVDEGVDMIVSKLQSAIREMSTTIPKDKFKMALESMYAELDDMINQ